MDILEKYRSIAITSLGRAGKTQLAVKFAKLAKEKKMPGGLYWVVIDGDEDKAL